MPSEIPEQHGGDSTPRAKVVLKPRRLPGDRGKPPMGALTWSSFFGAGYFPVAPGTAGTAAAIPLFWAMTKLYSGHAAIDALVFAAITILITWTGILAAERAGKYYGVADSGHIVIDEVAGYLVTMFALPWNPWLALLGFFWFRVTDVLKPWPARFFDTDPRWKNGKGVVLDDIFAGFWSLALTRGCWALAVHLPALNWMTGRS